jgi:hypothetical protein
MIGPVAFGLKPGGNSVTIFSNFGKANSKIAISCSASEGSAMLSWENAERQTGQIFSVPNGTTSVFTVSPDWLYIKASASVRRAPTIRIKVSYE